MSTRNLVLGAICGLIIAIPLYWINDVYAQPTQHNLFTPAEELVDDRTDDLVPNQEQPIATAALEPWLQVTDVTFPVLDHPASQVAPAIDEQRVVWHDERLGPADIFLADLATGEIVNLTHSLKWESNPDIAGDLVVWRDDYQGIGLHGLRLSTHEIFTVTVAQGDVASPKVSNGFVVWAAKQTGSADWQIFGYDLATRAQSLIADSAGIAPTVNIDGDWVVWSLFTGELYWYDRKTLQTNKIADLKSTQKPDVSAAHRMIVWQDGRNSSFDIYGWDLVKQREVPLIVAPAAQTMPRIADGLIAFQSQILTYSWNVHLYVLESQTTFPITDNPNRQAMPVTDGGMVVWEDSRNHQMDIYGFTWAGTPPPIIIYPIAAPSALQVGAFPQAEVQLHWIDTALGETHYSIERAAGITGTAWVEIANLPADSTFYKDLPPTLGESYWYRLRAVGAVGHSAYSNESFATSFSAVPSLDEMYLLTLVNEARADPAHFGYKEGYDPVPPLVYHPLIAYSAHSHSQSILNSIYQFGHCDPSGRCPTERARAVGYAGDCVENLIKGSKGSAAMEQANRSFLDSEGHRKAMLAADLDEIGIGHSFDIHKGEPDRHGQITEVICGRDGVTIPAIPSGAVAPYVGITTTTFTYTVNFYSQAGDPSQSQVMIDGVAHELTLSSGNPAWGTYRFGTQLALSESHEYYFLFEYGNGLQARWPESGSINAPAVVPNSTIDRISVNPAACAAVISWQTLGEAITTIHYGVNSTDEHSVAVDRVANSWHFFQIVGLAPLSNYRFRILSQDASGNQSQSEEQFFTTRSPRTSRVPQDYATIQAALVQARACDGVAVAAGSYSFSQTLQVPVGVLLLGAGMTQTTLSYAGERSAVTVADKAVVSGFTIEGANQGKNWDSGIWVESDASPTIVNNLIRGNLIGIASYCFELPCNNRPLIIQNLIIGNRDAGILDASGGSQIINNTFVQNKDGIRIDSKNTDTVVKNNIIVHNQNFGVHRDNEAIDLSYNNVWANPINYSNLEAGLGDLSTDPLFVDEAGHNVRLLPASPSIDAGDPAQTFLDKDGTRNDMGATGGSFATQPPQLIFSVSNSLLKVGDEVTIWIKLNNPAINTRNANLQIQIPEQAELIADSAMSPARSIEIAGKLITFHQIDLFFNLPVEISFKVKINPLPDENPQSLHFITAIDWGDGKLQSDNPVLVNGSAVYLPLVSR